MILIHKPVAQFSLPAAQFSHRRHPSAPPASAIQPQRTPGLITLSKPLAKQQQPQSRQRQSPKPKVVKSSPKLAEAPVALKRSPEIVDKKQSQATPEKSQTRGRQAKPKDGNKLSARSSSHSSVRGNRRNISRQASPPLLAPSQAEVPTSPVRKSNLFDPFADDYVSHTSKPVRPAPTLTSRPSGKLARRRHPVPTNPTPANTPCNTPPRAIHLPKRNDSSSPGISRSVPVLRRNVTSDIFPICDDLDEDADKVAVAFPATPSRPSRNNSQYDDGPHTAPISSSSSSSFPFAATSSPTPAPRRARKHHRVPSEGVFAMSSDEESSSSSSDPAAELKAFFGLFPKGRPTTQSFPESESERQIAAAATAAAMAPGCFFAGSAFQSSPSPEDLPPPSFV